MHSLYSWQITANSDQAGCVSPSCRSRPLWPLWSPCDAPVQLSGGVCSLWSFPDVAHRVSSSVWLAALTQTCVLCVGSEHKAKTPFLYCESFLLALSRKAPSWRDLFSWQRGPGCVWERHGFPHSVQTSVQLCDCIKDFYSQFSSSHMNTEQVSITRL